MARLGKPGRAALAIGASLLAGCASTPPVSRGAATAIATPPPSESLVLATFARTHEELWRPLVRSLEERFRLRTVYAWPMESLDEICVVFEIPAGRQAAEVAALLSEMRMVRSASPVSQYRTLAVPRWNDTYAGLQQGLVELGVPEAQRFATGRGVRVAVIDTGVDLAHPDLEGRVKVARNFVPRGDETFTRDAHGTAVAGVIAAAANNRIGIVGVAPDSELLALKACWPDAPGSRQATCDSYTLALALDFAIQSGARVLNLSLAGPDDPLLGRLLESAERRGVLAVTAVDETGAAPFPASAPSVVAVRAASPSTAGMSTLSPAPSTGRPAALRAPGTDVLTTGPGGTYDFYSGSSLAAAHVSGVAALLLERRPDLSVSALRELLRRSGVETADGARLSACSALAGLLETDVCGAAVAMERPGGPAGR